MIILKPAILITVAVVRYDYIPILQLALHFLNPNRAIVAFFNPLFQDSPQHEKILQEVVMDILRVLSSPDLEVRRKTLSLAMDLVTSRNIEEMVLVLKKV